MRRNCWEYMDCGREPGGVRADAEGVCPAATEIRLDGIHGGRNAGRACWAVAGTLRGDTPLCSHCGDDDCFMCDFYRTVLQEESPHLVFTPAILTLLETDQDNARWLKSPVD